MNLIALSPVEAIDWIGCLVQSITEASPPASASGLSLSAALSAALPADLLAAPLPILLSVPRLLIFGEPFLYVTLFSLPFVVIRLAESASTVFSLPLTTSWSTLSIATLSVLPFTMIDVHVPLNVYVPSLG